MSIEHLGVLALGVFVSYLLALGLRSSKLSLRVVMVVLGTALGGVPITFLASTPAKWLYPIGLLVGLLVAAGVSNLVNGFHLMNQPGCMAFDQGKISFYRSHVAHFAAMVIALVGLRWADPSVLKTQEGKFKGHAGQHEYVIYYPVPFERAPNLTVQESDSDTGLQIIEQRKDGFTVKLHGYVSGAEVNWSAKGAPGSAQ